MSATTVQPQAVSSSLVGLPLHIFYGASRTWHSLVGGAALTSGSPTDKFYNHVYDAGIVKVRPRRLFIAYRVPVIGGSGAYEDKLAAIYCDAELQHINQFLGALSDKGGRALALYDTGMDPLNYGLSILLLAVASWMAYNYSKAPTRWTYTHVAWFTAVLGSSVGLLFWRTGGGPNTDDYDDILAVTVELMV